MKKFTILCLSVLSFFSSCYNYDGPTREKRVISVPEPLPPIEVKKQTSKEYLAEMANAIEKALPDAEVAILEDSIKVLFPNNIVFGGSNIMPIEDIQVPMQKLAKLINRFSQTNILITGHADNGGDAEINKRISKLRADYVNDILVSNKVDQKRLGTWGLGSISPIASNDTEEGRKKNRRVEFVILSTIED